MKLSTMEKKDMKQFDTIQEQVESLMSNFESLQVEDSKEYRKSVMALFTFTKELICQDHNYSNVTELNKIAYSIWIALSCDDLIKCYERLSELALYIAQDIDKKNYDYSGEDDHDKILAWRNA